jgi:mannosyltransferase
MHVSGTDTEWVLRAPSALLAVGNVVAIYWLGVLIGSRIAGVLAPAVLATSGFHIYYSQEARMYTLLALAATLYAAAAGLLRKISDL